MTKKQLKKLAQEIAKLEHTIQTSDDKQVIYEAQQKMTHLTDSADLALEEMIVVDEMVQNYLQSKK